MLRDRFEYQDLKIRATLHARDFGVRLILVEETELGIALASDLKAAGLRAIAVKPHASKRTRLFIQAEKFHNGSSPPRAGNVASRFGG
jgi:hypothetical protein